MARRIRKARKEADGSEHSDDEHDLGHGSRGGQESAETISPGCHFNAPNIFVTAASYDCAGAFPLHIGMNELTKLHLYFANGEKKLYFTDADVNVVGAGTEPTGSAPIER